MTRHRAIWPTLTMMLVMALVITSSPRRPQDRLVPTSEVELMGRIFDAWLVGVRRFISAPPSTPGDRAQRPAADPTWESLERAISEMGRLSREDGSPSGITIHHTVGEVEGDYFLRVGKLTIPAEGVEIFPKGCGTNVRDDEEPVISSFIMEDGALSVTFIFPEEEFILCFVRMPPLYKK